MENEIVVREYQPNDRDGFLRLHNTVFGEFDSIDAYFEWTFEQCPYADSPTLTVAQHDERVVGVMGFLPTPVEFGGQQLLGIQSVDIMIEAEYRNFGLFRRLAAFSDRYFDEYDVVFGFPREETINLWQIVRDPTVVRCAPRQYYRPRRDGPPQTARSNFEVEIYEAGENIAEFVEDVPRRTVPNRIAPDRSPEYYAWRTERPKTDYRLFTVTEAGRVRGLMLVGHERNLDLLYVTETVLVEGSGAEVFDVGLRAVIDHYDDPDRISVPPGAPTEASVFRFIEAEQISPDSDIHHERMDKEPTCCFIAEPLGDVSSLESITSTEGLNVAYTLSDRY